MASCVLKYPYITYNTKYNVHDVQIVVILDCLVLLFGYEHPALQKAHVEDLVSS